MNASPAIREEAYRTFLDFFEVAERKRRWNVFDDIPWDRLDTSKNTERTALARHKAKAVNGNSGYQ